jgi:hypothetical protein
VIVLVATLHLTFACHAQDHNAITSLNGAVFPVGLPWLGLVSIHYCRLCFGLCICAVRGACGIDVA